MDSELEQAKALVADLSRDLLAEREKSMLLGKSLRRFTEAGWSIEQLTEARGLVEKYKYPGD